MSKSQILFPVIKNITIAAIGAMAGLLISKVWKSYFDQPVTIIN